MEKIFKTGTEAADALNKTVSSYQKYIVDNKGNTIDVPFTHYWKYFDDYEKENGKIEATSPEERDNIVNEYIQNKIFNEGNIHYGNEQGYRSLRIHKAPTPQQYEFITKILDDILYNGGWKKNIEIDASNGSKLGERIFEDYDLYKTNTDEIVKMIRNYYGNPIK